jgi:hypothetical protein
MSLRSAAAMFYNVALHLRDWRAMRLRFACLVMA